jgi:hypothetical protein
MPSRQEIHIRATTVNINPPTQQELNLESNTSSLTMKCTPRLKEFLEQEARRRGKGTSDLIRMAILRYFKLEAKLLAFRESIAEILD